MNKVLISACLMGEAVRYDGTGKRVNTSILKQWEAEQRLVPLCPELQGGLPVPRNRAEIRGGNGNDVVDGKAQVVDDQGNDVSLPFLEGAQKTLEHAQAHQVVLAILTEKSPSCGSSLIYNGQFDGTQIPGMGVTTALLRKHGIAVFNQSQFEEAQHYLEELEK